MKNKPIRSGLYDRDNKEICLGDLVRYKCLEMQYQEHGEPFGYEPLGYELGIFESVVVFDNGMFHLDDEECPLFWDMQKTCIPDEISDEELKDIIDEYAYDSREDMEYDMSMVIIKQSRKSKIHKLLENEEI
jgi:hypothetical protein